MQTRELLEWYLEAGVDEAVDDFVSCVAQSASTGSPSVEKDPVLPLGVSLDVRPLHHSPSAATASARARAGNAKTLQELEACVREFEGCALKKTASKTVFSDGNPQANVMIIGEAPGAQEDIQGIPFCGASGQLLDRMLAAIGLDRTSVYISNTVFWRPPGNRQPSPEETNICLPFVEKHIALVAPSLLILSGGTATTTLLGRDTSISKLRGKLYDYSNPYLAAPIPALVTYHPSYLLRTPTQKRLAWEDLLMVKQFLNNKGIA